MKRFCFFMATVTAFVVMSGCSSEDKHAQMKKEIPPMPVEVITVHKEKIPIWIRYTATTKASSEQEVRARVSGRLEKRFFKDGQMVQKGDKLFLIEQAPYKSALDAALAQKARDEAGLRLAKANVDRYTPLVNEGLAPRAKLEEYQSQQDSYLAALQADKAKIEEAKLNLSYTVVRAPVSGKISARHVDVGNLVGYDGPTLLTTIMQINPLYAYFSPSESDFAKINRYATKQKLDVFAEIGSGQTKFERERLKGYVDFTNNAVDPSTSTVSMRATLSNPKGDILPGTFVYINLFVSDKFEFIMVPPQVIFEDQQGKFVYVVGEDAKAHRTSVVTALSSKYYVQIEKGLKDGDKVIVSGLVKVRDGSPVTPKDVTQTKGIMAIIKVNHLIPTQE